MIRINLIPAKKKKKAKPVPKFIIALVLLTLLSAVASWLAVSFYNGKISDLQDQKRSNEAKIAELKKKIKEVEGYEERNRIFQERKKLIEELTKNQSLPAKLLDELAARLTQGVWVTSITISRNGISISGVGFTNSDIVDYIESLKASPMFEGVTLGGTTSASISQTNVYNFTLNMKIKV